MQQALRLLLAHGAAPDAPVSDKWRREAIFDGLLPADTAEGGARGLEAWGPVAR